MNKSYDELTATEQSNTHIVATATPASFVADNGPYVSVNEDFLASTLFAFLDALPTNTANNTIDCEGDLASVNRWVCHGFKEEYMAAGKLSRNKIVADIIAVLPTQPQIFAYEKGRIEPIWFRNIDSVAPGGWGSLYSPAGNQTINSVSFYMWRREASAGGSLEMRVYAENGTILTTSNPVNGDDVILNIDWFDAVLLRPKENTGGWIAFSFPTSVPLVFGNRYLITVLGSGGITERQSHFIGTTYSTGFSPENVCIYLNNLSPFSRLGCNAGAESGESTNMRIE